MSSNLQESTHPTYNNVISNGLDGFLIVKQKASDLGDTLSYTLEEPLSYAEDTTNLKSGSVNFQYICEDNKNKHIIEYNPKPNESKPSTKKYVIIPSKMNKKNQTGHQSDEMPVEPTHKTDDD